MENYPGDKYDTGEGAQSLTFKIPLNATACISIVAWNGVGVRPNISIAHKVDTTERDDYYRHKTDKERYYYEVTEDGTVVRLDWDSLSANLLLRKEQEDLQDVDEAPLELELMAHMTPIKGIEARDIQEMWDQETRLGLNNQPIGMNELDGLKALINRTKRQENELGENLVEVDEGTTGTQENNRPAYGWVLRKQMELLKAAVAEN